MIDLSGGLHRTFWPGLANPGKPIANVNRIPRERESLGESYHASLLVSYQYHTASPRILALTSQALSLSHRTQLAVSSLTHVRLSHTSTTDHAASSCTPRLHLRAPTSAPCTQGGTHANTCAGSQVSTSQAAHATTARVLEDGLGLSAMLSYTATSQRISSNA